MTSSDRAETTDTADGATNIESLLQPYQRFGVHLGLERIERLLARLGQPQQRVPFIHVAGTNGKGSVCAYLSAALTAAGYRVGRYTSPHLVDWTERIAIGDRPISPAEFVAALERTIAAIDPNFEAPTLFEVVTAAAWELFARRELDIAVIEVGLGGRLDATNVAIPAVAAITSISRDHWQRLGDTIAAIAGEKAGILKPQIPAVVAPQVPLAEAVIAERARQLNCPVLWSQPAIPIASDLVPGASSNAPDIAADIVLRRARYRDLDYDLMLPGDVQLINSAMAIDILQVLRARGWDKLTDVAIARGLAHTRWPGRLQWLQWRDRTWLIDGAHNLAAAQALRRYADAAWQGQPKTWLLGLLATKDCDGILRALLAPGDRLYVVPIPGHECVDPDTLAAKARHHCPQLIICQTHIDLAEAIAQIDHLEPEIRAIATGSLYLAGHLLRLCQRT